MSLDKLKAKLLSDPEVKSEYDKLKPEFDKAVKEIKMQRSELRSVMGTDDSLNNVKIPKRLRSKLMAAFKHQPHTGHSSDTERWFTVWDDKTNDRLSKIIPLATEGMPCYWIDNYAFLVWFDWSIQRFIISV